MAYRLLVLALAVLLCGTHVLSSSQCYYPDGSLATDYPYIPCTGSQFASCCNAAEGDACLSNGLCSWPGNYPYRAACTGLCSNKLSVHLLNASRPNVAISKLHQLLQVKYVSPFRKLRFMLELMVCSKPYLLGGTGNLRRFKVLLRG